MFYNRLGSDLIIEWPISVEGVDDISELDLTLYVICNRYRKKMRFTTENNTIRFTFYGIDQRVCGVYDLELVLNEDDYGQVICDNKNAFELYGEVYEDYKDIYVTKAELSQMSYATESYVVDYVNRIDMSNFVTYSYLYDQHYLVSIPPSYVTYEAISLMGYATQSYVADYVQTYAPQPDLSSYVTKTELSNAGYITMGDVSACGYLTSIPTEYITQDELSANGYLTAVPSDYATKSYVSDYVNEYAPQVDLSSYVTKTELSECGYITMGDVSTCGYLTSIPAEYITETELSGMGYLTSVPSEYATKSYVSDYVNEYAPQPDLSSYVTKTELNNAGYLTSIPAEYITQAELSANGYLTAIPSNYVTTTMLNNQSYVTTTALNTRLNNAGYITMGDVAACGYISSIPSEYITQAELSANGYLTSIPNDYATYAAISAMTYATQSYVMDAIEGIEPITYQSTYETTYEVTNEISYTTTTIWMGSYVQYQALSDHTAYELYLIQQE